MVPWHNSYATLQDVITAGVAGFRASQALCSNRRFGMCLGGLEETEGIGLNHMTAQGYRLENYHG